MDFYPPRRLGLTFGSALLFAALGLSTVGLYLLATSGISPWLILWVLLPLLGAPASALICYHLYGLLTAQYRLDREGIRITWGFAVEQIPISAVAGIQQLKDFRLAWRPGKGAWWPGCATGSEVIDGLGEVELFTADLRLGVTVIDAGRRKLAITPRNPRAFQEAFSKALQSGSLEPMPAVSQRPDLLVGQIWSDAPARWLILAGLMLPLSLLAFLSFTAPRLSEAVPFGFTPAGLPSTMAPGGRLLLLPLIGGFIWALDVLVGSWLVRREGDFSLAYALWSIGLLVGALFWGASLHLLAAA